MWACLWHGLGFNKRNVEDMSSIFTENCDLFLQKITEFFYSPKTKAISLSKHHPFSRKFFFFRAALKALKCFPQIWPFFWTWPSGLISINVHTSLQHVPRFVNPRHQSRMKFGVTRGMCFLPRRRWEKVRRKRIRCCQQICMGWNALWSAKNILPKENVLIFLKENTLTLRIALWKKEVIWWRLVKIYSRCNLIFSQFFHESYCKCCEKSGVGDDQNNLAHCFAKKETKWQVNLLSLRASTLGCFPKFSTRAVLIYI